MLFWDIHQNTILNSLLRMTERDLTGTTQKDTPESIWGWLVLFAHEERFTPTSKTVSHFFFSATKPLQACFLGEFWIVLRNSVKEDWQNGTKIQKWLTMCMLASAVTTNDTFWGPTFKVALAHGTCPGLTPGLLAHLVQLSEVLTLSVCRSPESIANGDTHNCVIASTSQYYQTCIQSCTIKLCTIIQLSHNCQSIVTSISYIGTIIIQICPAVLWSSSDSNMRCPSWWLRIPPGLA